MESGDREPTRFRRRKRRYQGATWTPSSMSAFAEDGIWCKACRQRHGYISMELKYEKRSNPLPEQTKYKLLWYCPRTHNLLEER